MARLTAWSLLRSPHGLTLRDVGREAERAGLDPRDRALVRRLVGTDVRRRGTLRAILQVIARGKPSADLSAVLRLGLIQIFFLDGVKDHAAVSETVEVAHRVVGPSKARYTNAVLRTAIGLRREGVSGDPRRDLVGRDMHLDHPVFRDPEQHPLLWAEDALSMPAALVKRWVQRYGQERAHQLARDALDEASLSVRVVRGERADIEAELGLTARHGAHDAILLVDFSDTEAVLSSAAFAEGRITIQGETALRAAELVGAREGERALDTSAAPGGKTAVMAGAGAEVVACDVHLRRLARVTETVGRLGVAGRVHNVVSDTAAAFVDGTFDAVLVDTPCSNTGVLAQRPDARWRYGPASQRSLNELQARLLARGATRVRPGGRIVYSTCSLEPEENGRVVRAFLDAHAGFELEEELEAQPNAAEGPIDGGYAARLRAR